MRITPVRTSKIKKLLERHGWVKDRQNGSHIAYIKDNEPRPIIVIDESETDKWLVKQIMGRLNLSKHHFYQEIRKL